MHSNCEEYLRIALSKPKFKKILEAIGNIPINCIDCSHLGTEGKSKALILIDPLRIEICKNRNSNGTETELSILHELVHAYDFKLGRYDMFTSDGLAASEVRAAREAECSGSFIFPWGRAQCIKERAIASTAV